ncbi:hypothetical protein BG22_06140 [Bifidobacterium sp. UTBIF-78]|nr:hypothetical protein BG22_06140 [Bifidobacterium sp. UTBIF-78]
MAIGMCAATALVGKQHRSVTGLIRMHDLIAQRLIAGVAVCREHRRADPVIHAVHGVRLPRTSGQRRVHVLGHGFNRERRATGGRVTTGSGKNHIAGSRRAIEVIRLTGPPDVMRIHACRHAALPIRAMLEVLTGVATVVVFFRSWKTAITTLSILRLITSEEFTGNGV